MKTFLKYFLILGLSYSCAAMTPKQQLQEQQNQEKLSQLLDIMQKQQEDKKQQAEMSKQPKASSSSSYYSKARKVVAGLLVAAGVAGLTMQNANLQRQISAIVLDRAARDSWEVSKWSIKFVVCCLGGNPLAALLFV